MTKIDPWFLRQMEEVSHEFKRLAKRGALDADEETMRSAKRMGFSDTQLARAWNTTELDVREHRKSMDVRAVFNRVDTCAAEFESFTPYLYSSYESECEAEPTDRKKIVILGSGPNRIGQGIEFDYCCCHASFALQNFGCESIMVNCNPETVSTDYDTSDRLYFEPLTLEEVLNICDTEKPDGLIVQFGGQTPLTLALPLSVGLSLDNYYDEGPGGRDQTFGYFDVGLAASVPLAFISGDYGTWSASATVDYLALSATLADVNRGDGGFWVGKAGVAFSY